MAKEEPSERATGEADPAPAEDQRPQGPEAPASVDAGEPADVDALQRQLADAQARAEANWEKVLRVQAELENARKRAQRDLEHAHKYALERFAGELLAVKDSLELGLDATSSEADATKLREGTALTLKMLTQALEKFNVQEIDPQGQPFNPEHHQAMSVQQSAELAPNSVAMVMQKGYLLNDRLLRPAMVIVSKAPSSEHPQASEGDGAA